MLLKLLLLILTVLVLLLIITETKGPMRKDQLLVQFDIPWNGKPLLPDGDKEYYLD